MSPRPWPDRLVVVLLLRQVIALAEQAPRLTEAELTARLITLAGWVR